MLVWGCAENPLDGLDAQYDKVEIFPGGVVPPNTVILAEPSSVPKQLLLNSLIMLDVFSGSYNETLLEKIQPLLSVIV